MAKLGNILRTAGKIASAVSAVTPEGKAVTHGLRVGGELLANVQVPDAPRQETTLQEVAVQAILENLPGVAAIKPQNVELCEHLSNTTRQIEAWLTLEAQRTAAAGSAK